MRISIFLLFLCTFTLMAENVNSQNAKVTIKRTNTQLETILNDIEAQTDYLFIYKKDVDVTEKKSIDASNKTVSEVLRLLLVNSRIDYRMEGNHIVLLNNSNRQDQAQQNMIVGVVTDAMGEPLIGVTVLVKGATQGAITDVDGKFSLPVKMGDVLSFSYVGYVPLSVKVTNLKQLTIEMKEDSKMLEEVVVVGYGSMKKKDLTGAVSSINSQKLEKEAPGTVQDLLRGGIPGLNVGMTSSAKGGGTIQVRGQRSLKAGNDPLIVLDGIIFSGELSEVNP